MPRAHAWHPFSAWDTYFPPGQPMHLLCPEEYWNWPEAHLVQLSKRVAVKVPGLQSAHDCCPELPWNLCIGQFAVNR
jgi:hypothetical protein